MEFHSPSVCFCLSNPQADALRRKGGLALFGHRHFALGAGSGRLALARMKTSVFR
ncbi:hypothetical protein B4135_0904 [Caldibacillus debilis]|uniref:Uncharacterized protein n=1 Tax=Caldibacillus debilis TaxID=301148 RepID=A0A150M6H3_9BACI|nr:hypothetical protein B4135_0904 [Caldibacillus debilis]